MSIWAPSPAPGSGVGEQDEGVVLPRRGSINWTGTGVTASDDPTNNRTNVNIPGASFGGGSYPATVLTSQGSDDSTYFQNALNAAQAAGGGEIVLNGWLNLSSTAVYNGSNLRIRAAGGPFNGGLRNHAVSSRGITLLKFSEPNSYWNYVESMSFGMDSGGAKPGVQTLTITGASDGTFDLGRGGNSGESVPTTGPLAGLPYNISAAALQSAINSAALGFTAVCTGGPLNTSPITITHNTARAGWVWNNNTVGGTISQSITYQGGNTKSGGYGLDFNTNYSSARDCWFTNQYSCIRIGQDSQLHSIEDCFLWEFAYDGIDGWCTDRGVAGRGNDYRIRNIETYTNQHYKGSGGASVRWRSMDPMLAYDLSVQQTDYGIKIDNDGADGSKFGWNVEWGIIDRAVLDNCKSACISITSTSGKPVRHIYFNNIVSDFSPTADSLVIDGNVQDIHFNNVLLEGGKYGVRFPRTLAGTTAKISFDRCWVNNSVTKVVSFAAGTWDQIKFTNCAFEDTSGVGVFDFGGATFTNSRFEDNSFVGVVTPAQNFGGLISASGGSRTSRVGGNIGWIPLAVPPSSMSSGVAVNNPNPFDCTVYVAGGTVSAIEVNGIALTGITSGPVRVPAGTSLKVTYSAAPTLTWVAS